MRGDCTTRARIYFLCTSTGIDSPLASVRAPFALALFSPRLRTGGCHDTHLGLRISGVFARQEKKRDLGGRLEISQAVFFSTLEFRSVSLGVRNLGCDPQYPHPAGLSPIVSGYRFQPHPPLSCLPDCSSPAGRTRPG